MKDVTVGKIASLTKVERAYIAGFLDGDGSVMALVERHPEKKFKIRIRVLVEFTQHDDNMPILKYLYRKIGSGNINRSLRNVWKYGIKNQRIIEQLLKALYPYSVLKKRQIKLALKILSIRFNTRKSLLRAAILADKLSSLNLRSKSRKINGIKLVKEAISRND